MDLSTRVAVLSVLAATTVVTGVVLIVTQGPALTALGALLVIGSAIVFMFDVADMLVLQERGNADVPDGDAREIDASAAAETPD
ncbi:MAG: hypothetical protein ABEJ42_01860 [Halobacteriaceae archaeon]